MIRIPIVGVALLAALAVAGASPAAESSAAAAQKELTTAAEHLSFALRAKSVAMVHAHLHHALNCLVGEKGAEFDPKAEYPCRGMGNGAIPDLVAANAKPEVQTQATQARDLAAIAVSVQDTSAAKNVARAVHTLIERAARELGPSSGMGTMHHRSSSAASGWTSTKKGGGY